MDWGDPPNEPRGSAVLPAVASLVCCVLACPFPPAALAAVVLAHLAWWKCLQNAATRGFACTLLAMATSHLIYFSLLLLIVQLALGGKGAFVVMLLLLVYCAILVISSRSRAAMTTYVVGGSAAVLLTLCVLGVSSARHDAQRNLLFWNLHRAGLERLAEESRGHRNALDGPLHWASDFWEQPPAAEHSQADSSPPFSVPSSPAE